MSEVATVDLSLARFVKLEERIDGGEHDAILARWEFGRALLSERENKQLPKGRLAELIEATGKSRTELQYRMQFAERFRTLEEVSNALDTFTSWRDVVAQALPLREEPPPAEPLPDLSVGTYRTIVADPPWQYGNTSTRGAAEDHYATMSIEELCAIPVREWSALESHLYLWTTNGFLREAFDVMDAWGFTYKTTLVWVKPQIGMGNYFRSSSEYVLFGVLGGLRTKDCNQRNWFEAPRGKHSKKPGLFFDIVETASHAPYLEMFARDRRLNPDWHYWGNEA
jgi:N6-adenosine-specific RNA methylase IME4